MPSRYPLFDRSRLELKPLSQRRHDLDASVVAPLGRVAPGAEMTAVAARLREARKSGRARILMMGAHVLRSGMQLYLADMLRKGFVSCVAVNGACAIHDYEMALAGATTESVARYIRDGSFGMWRETGELNRIINEGAAEGLGLGEAVGRHISRNGCPRKDVSLFATAYELGIPVTVHVGIGYDIIHQHPDCDGAALGAASYTDFLILAEAMRSLEGGAVMNFGSAVMAPEIFLKALSMVRNAVRDGGGSVADFVTLVCDLFPLPEDYAREPSKSESAYYFRPWKTMLVRTVADGGKSYYVRGAHRETFPRLWSALEEPDAPSRGA